MKKLNVSRKEISKLESRNDRYSAYGLIGAKVCFLDGYRKVTGVVDKVIRSVFDDTVTVVVKDKEYVFPEPQLMYADDDAIVFIYGDLDSAEMDDEELFKEARGSGFSGETVHDVLKRTEKGSVTEHRFDILKQPSEESKKKPAKESSKKSKKSSKKKGKK